MLVLPYINNPTSTLTSSSHCTGHCAPAPDTDMPCPHTSPHHDHSYPYPHLQGARKHQRQAHHHHPLHQAQKEEHCLPRGAPEALEPLDGTGELVCKLVFIKGQGHDMDSADLPLIYVSHQTESSTRTGTRTWDWRLHGNGRL